MSSPVSIHVYVTNAVLLFNYGVYPTKSEVTHVELMVCELCGSQIELSHCIAVFIEGVIKTPNRAPFIHHILTTLMDIL